MERGGEIVYRQPFRAGGVRMWCFVLRADAARLDATWDRYFNHPSGGAEQLSSAGPLAILTFVDIATLASTDREDRDVGTTRERECGIWVPGLDHRRGHRLVWNIPYIFVDGSWPMATGRETYGFPKQLAEVDFDVDGDQVSRFSVDSMAVRRFAADATAEHQRVLEVRRVDAGTRASAVHWPDADAARAHLHALRQHPEVDPSPSPPPPLPKGPHLPGPLVDAAGLGLALFDGLAGDCVSLLLLKQFRDGTDPQRACYQAVLDVPMKVLELRGGGLVGDDYEVELADLDSEPIARELGLPSGPLGSELAFWIDFDFQLETATELWRAVSRATP